MLMMTINESPLPNRRRRQPQPHILLIPPHILMIALIMKGLGGVVEVVLLFVVVSGIVLVGLVDLMVVWG